MSKLTIAVLGAAIGAHANAPTFEISSSDLAGSGRAFDNIKAKWSQSLNVLGLKDANLECSYDRAERSDFLNEATLSGSSGKVKYELTSRFSGATDYSLETTTEDGSTITAEGSTDLSNPLASTVKKVSAAKGGLQLRGHDYDLEMSHQFSDSESKLKLSSVLGAGVKAIATLATKGGSHDTNIDVEYDTTLNKGRTLHVEVNPRSGSGEIEYEDSSTLDGTLTANMPLGGSPKVSFKRAFSF
jgi:hypothetical protein